MVVAAKREEKEVEEDEEDESCHTMLLMSLVWYNKEKLHRERTVESMRWRKLEEEESS